MLYSPNIPNTPVLTDIDLSFLPVLFAGLSGTTGEESEELGSTCLTLQDLAPQILHHRLLSCLTIVPALIWLMGSVSGLSFDFALY